MIQIENCYNRFAKMILTELSDRGISTWIAGGAVRDYFMGISMNTDHDLFFPDQANYNKCKDYFDEIGGKVLWESDNGMKISINGKTYDLVKKFFPDPQASIDAFDFTVSMFAVTTDKVYFAPTAFMDLAKRQLMINKITYPASTMMRAFKYYKKGFIMCKGEMKKIVEAIQNMEKKELVDTQETTEETETSGDSIFSGID